jgi:hypothetical protein
MNRLYAALLGGVVSAIAIGIWMIAYMSNVGLSGGHVISQHDRGIFMIIAAVLGFLVFGAAATPPNRTHPPE